MSCKRPRLKGHRCALSFAPLGDLMKPIYCVHMLTLLASMLGTLLFAQPCSAQTAAPPPAAQVTLPSETPAKFAPVTASFDHIRRDVMIPMRDGVKLHTVILVPKGAKGAPILLTRTPYNATDLTSHAPSSHLGPILSGYDNATDVIVEGGYIRVVQDVRGKYDSEGRRSLHRHLRHHRLAGEKYSRKQRQGRHSRHFLRRFHALDGPRQSASRAQGVRADEPHGGRLDGRRLVPLRRLPATEYALHL